MALTKPHFFGNKKKRIKYNNCAKNKTELQIPTIAYDFPYNNLLPEKNKTFVI